MIVYLVNPIYVDGKLRKFLEENEGGIGYMFWNDSESVVTVNTDRNGRLYIPLSNVTYIEEV